MERGERADERACGIEGPPKEERGEAFTIAYAMRHAMKNAGPSEATHDRLGAHSVAMGSHEIDARACWSRAVAAAISGQHDARTRFFGGGR
jgi:hypothetical protein